VNGIKLTGLWKNKGKDGKTFLSGTLGGVKLLIFANDYKKAGTDPDYNLVIAPREREEKEKPTHEAHTPDPDLGF
jgi:hypothetical protein